MLNTVEAVLQPDGVLQFLEPISVTTPRRVLVTFTEPIDEVDGGAALRGREDFDSHFEHVAERWYGRSRWRLNESARACAESRFKAHA